MPAPFSSEETLAEAVTPWAVTASHTNLDQAISSSTNVTLSDGTVGNYNEGLLFADHRISLPLPGTITHFVSPQQPTFTFTQPTRVFMFIPTTTNVAPIRREGWVYIPQGLSGSASPFLNFPVPVLDELFSGVISSVNYDYCYEKFFTAGTYNLDPNALAPEAFYLFEELIDGNVLSELRQRQMYVFEEGVLPGAPGGNYGIGTTNPSAKLHVVGDIKASGSGNIIASGDITATDSGSIIEVGKNTDGVSHINRARIESASFGPGSIVSWSHHDCSLGSNLALAQSNEGETLLNSESNKSLQFRIGGLEKMRVHSNGFVGINQTSPAEALDVGGSIKATGHLHKLISTQEQNSVVITKDNHDLLGIAGSKGAGLIIHGDATSLNAYGGSLAITGSQVNKGGLGPFFEFLGSRSTYDQLASGTHTAVTDGDVLGYFRWMGDDGNDCRSRAADISCEIDGTVAENTVPGAIRFSTRNSSNYRERMRLSATGNVGIGTTSPDYKLDVNGSMKSLGVIYGSTSPAITKEWKMFCHGNGNLHFDFQNGNGNFVTKGYLNQNVVVGAIDFTGQHRSKFEGDFTSKLVGLIVESTGAYLELDGSVQPKIDEALPSVKLTTAAKSKRVYGVLSNIEGGTREYGSGFVTVVPKDDNITRVVVNSVGEGSLWVINTREQALENGDYICSSNVAGYGEKQDDDILHSYTVAKITMSLDWSNLPDWLETRNVTASGEVSETGEYKAAFVGVTYHCG